MRILLIAMSNSIHTARWISQINKKGWDIHLFPCCDIDKLHPEISGVTVYNSFYKCQREQYTDVIFKGIHITGAGRLRSLLADINPDYRLNQLRKLISRIKPDIIHSLETQLAGYMVSKVKESYKEKFPLWTHSIWGSDLYLFGAIEKHKEQIRKVISGCDHLFCEGNRDIRLAKTFGYNGLSPTIVPGAGGLNIEKTNKLQSNLKTSDRKSIILKGYDGWAGRALVGLRALKRCTSVLENHVITIYSAVPSVEIAAELFAQSTGLEVNIIPNGSSHNILLEEMGRARLHIALSISDGLPNSFLEAMAMGAFPIQSNTSLADEWINDGTTGILVPPEDPEIIEQAIRTALLNDRLVDRASSINSDTIKKRANYIHIAETVCTSYNDLLSVTLKEKGSTK